MPRNPSGVYSLPASYLAVAGDTIRTEQHNPPFEDVAQALTDSLPRSGVAPMTGNLAMGAKKITGLAAGTNASDALRFDQRLGGSAWLLSVSALALAANEFVYATGVNTAAKATITAAGLALLDDANAAAQRTTLGLGSAAIADLTDDDDLSVDPDNLGTRGNMAAAIAAGASTWTELAPVATTSGTAVDLVSLPSGITEFVLDLDLVSSNSTGDLLLQLGTGGVPTTTGYQSGGNISGTISQSTTGFISYLRQNGNAFSGTFSARRYSGNIWHGTISGTVQGGGYAGAARIVLAGELDNLPLTLTAGSFDAGEMRLRYM